MSNIKDYRSKPCMWCGKSFHVVRAGSMYCSKACKQKAYRRRVDPEVGSIQREKQRQENIAITKQITTKVLNCECCGRMLEVGINHTNLMYCSDACKQKAYRQRKANKSPGSMPGFLIVFEGKITD